MPKRHRTQELLYFWVLSELPPPPLLDNFYNFFSDIEIQDLKVSLGLKIIYIHYDIVKTGIRHSAISFKTVQYILGYISLQRAWSHKWKYTNTALLYRFQYRNEIFTKIYLL